MKRSFIIFALFIIASSMFTVMAQEKAEVVKPFSLWIQISAADQVSLEKEEPKTGFVKLTFSLDGKQKWIDQNGMVIEKIDKPETAEGFLIGIKTNGEQIELSCKKGCKWERVGFGPKSRRWHLDETGVDGIKK